MRSAACLPCRERKMRCDSTQGVPCSRCLEDSKIDECIVPPRAKRRISRTCHKNSRRNPHQLTDQPRSASSDRPESLEVPGPEGATTSVHGNMTGNVDCGNTMLQKTCEPISIPHQSTLAAPIARDDFSTIQYQNRMPASLDQPDLLDVPELEGAATSSLGDMTRNVDCDDGVLQKTCELIAIPRRGSLTAPIARDEFSTIQYHNRMNFVRILGEVISGHDQVNRVVHVDYPLPSNASESPRTRLELETSGLDSHDTAYLFGKKAFTLPPQDLCDEFLVAYFTYAYPYAPIFDRCELLMRYRQQQHSSFVMQALLSYAVSFVDENLIHRAGFETHREARETFYSRAVLLYNFDCEKSRLDLLQGSLLLGLSYISHHCNKDHHYWFANALRIATNMGMHQRDAREELEPRSYKLFKRIWCVILIRDISFSTLGQANNLQVSLQYSMPDLTENDWSEDLSRIPPDLRSMLPYPDPRHPQFLIQMFELAKTSKDAYSIVLSQDPSEVNQNQAREVLQSLLAWRCALPKLFWPESITCWSTQGLWTLILLIWYARIECHIRRTLWKGIVTAKQEDFTARSHFTNAILEFDMAIRKAMLHNLCEYMPLATSFAVATNIAFSVELLTSSNLSVSEKPVCEEAVVNGISYLTQVQSRWPRIQAMLRLFSWVLELKGLYFKSKFECMGIEVPIQTDEPAFQESESLSSDTTDANILNMLPGFDTSMNVDSMNIEDWINFPF